MPRRAARLKVEETVDGDVVGNELRDVAAEIRSADRRDVAKLTRTRAMTPVERRRLEASVHERVEPFGNAGRTPSDVRRSDRTLERAPRRPRSAGCRSRSDRSGRADARA